MKEIFEQECEICFNNVVCYEMDYICSEKHQFCNKCIQQYLEQQINLKKVENIPCLDANCQKILTDSEVKAHLNFIMLDKYKQVKQEIILNRDSNTRWCTKCENHMTGTLLHQQNKIKELQCGQCQQKICFQCKQDWHPNKKCSKQKDYLEVCRKSGITNCPLCKSPIQKNNGCDHMTCTQCSYEFCWSCKSKWSDTHYYPWGFGSCPGIGYQQYDYLIIKILIQLLRIIIYFFRGLLIIFFFTFCSPFYYIYLVYVEMNLIQKFLIPISVKIWYEKIQTEKQERKKRKIMKKNSLQYQNTDTESQNQQKKQNKKYQCCKINQQKCANKIKLIFLYIYYFLVFLITLPFVTIAGFTIGYYVVPKHMKNNY